MRKYPKLVASAFLVVANVFLSDQFYILTLTALKKKFGCCFDEATNQLRLRQPA
jgi:hypothetical protein